MPTWQHSSLTPLQVFKWEWKFTRFLLGKAWRQSFGWKDGGKQKTFLEVVSRQVHRFGVSGLTKGLLSWEGGEALSSLLQLSLRASGGTDGSRTGSYFNKSQRNGYEVPPTKKQTKFMPTLAEGQSASAKSSLWLLPLLWPILSKMSQPVPKCGFILRFEEKVYRERRSLSKRLVCTQAPALPRAALSQQRSGFPMDVVTELNRLRPGILEKRHPLSMFAQSLGVIRIVVVSLCVYPADGSWTIWRPTPLAWIEPFVMFCFVLQAHLPCLIF